jgi:hypothetical protein
MTPLLKTNSSKMVAQSDVMIMKQLESHVYLSLSILEMISGRTHRSRTSEAEARVHQEKGDIQESSQNGTTNGEKDRLFKRVEVCFDVFFTIAIAHCLGWSYT